MLAPDLKSQREPGATFRSDQLAWLDWETKSPVDIENGTFRYMAQASPLILACALGDAPAIALPWPLTWRSLPPEIRAFHKRVQAGDAVWAAWNASFDREVWNQLTDFPELEVEQVIDVMAQATAAGLPGTLDGAGRFSGCGRKTADSKKLIKLFAIEGADPAAYPVEWNQFLIYAANDIEVMRAIFKHTLQLPIQDWEEYWVNERVNLRGIRFDRSLAQRAAAMAKVDKKIAAVEISRLTDGVVTAVTQVQRMAKWIHQEVPDSLVRSAITKREEEIDEESGEVKKAAKFSLTRRRITLLLAQLGDKAERSEIEERALRLLQIRHYGGSTTPYKFTRMLETCLDDELLGMFVFNGAPQTGRFSSRTVQLHNLMRDALPYEMDAIDALLNDISPEAFAVLGDATPISRKLSMLIRPTLAPADGNAFVWGDWEQIEARKLPWLAASAGGEARLDIFRAVDEDPSIPDLYTRTAADLSSLPLEQIDKPLRQRGKVTELACQYGGGANALQNMAANYGMRLENDLAKETVYKWRETNTWATELWSNLFAAVQNAMEAPGQTFTVGRVVYVYLKGYLGGSVLCQLPSGRMLTYRRIRWERIDEEDDDGNVIDSNWHLTYARGYGRVKLWHGILAENITQASAACVLRGTLVRLKQWPIRAHTHDEILAEVATHAAEASAASLVRTMELGFDWSAGLPLKAESTMGYSYSKCEEAQGL